MLSRERIKGNSFLFSKLLQILMLLYGIDINGKVNRRLSTKLKRFHVFFSFTICHLAFFVSFKYAVALALLASKASIKNLIIVNLATVNSIIMWYSLYFKRHELFELLSEVSLISDRMSVSLAVGLPKFCIMYIFLSFLVAGMITGRMVFTGSETIAAIFINLPMSTCVVSFYLTIFCCFYICLCNAFHSMLKKILRSVNHRDLTPRSVKVTNGRYRETLITLVKAEEILSCPVFFLLVTTFIFLFFCFYICLIVGIIPGGLVSLAFIQSLINFAVLFYFTIRVHEIDKKIKSVLKNSVKRPELLRQCDEHVESLKLTAYEEAFSFSAWGFFWFTKGFFVGALGSGLTYMLLVTQI